MEVEGARTIFETFPAIENVYVTCNEPRKVLKRECVGYVQKGVGNRLRKLNGGKGKLTKAIIYRLQNYYGITIRSNKDDIAGMKTASYASLFHVASSLWHADGSKIRFLISC